MTVNGVRHSTITLVSTALGGGVLSVSYVMRLSGVGLGTLMLLTGGLLSFLSIKALMQMSVQTGRDSYGALFAYCAGARAGPILDAMLCFYGVGSCTGYMVFLSDFVPALVHFSAPDAPAWASSREVAILGAFIVLLPLVAQRDVAWLRFIAPVSIVSLLYMALVVMFKMPALHNEHLHDSSYGSVVLFRPDLHIFEAFALCIFAFNCHMNVVPVAGSLQRPTEPRIVKISARVNALQLCFYCLIGISGYLSFCDKTPQDILLGYSSSDLAVAGGRVLLTGTMLVAIPLNMYPTVRSALQIGDYFRGGAVPEERVVWPRLILTIGFLAIEALLALVVPGVADVLSLLGATVATAMMLGIPAYAMHVILPGTRANRVKQAVLWFFAAVSVSSVPIKLLRYTQMLHQ